jgi:drug/metabolite transporter (DMT)-like permease
MVNPRLIVIALGAVLAMSAVPVLVKSTAANEVTIGIVRLCIAALAFTPIVLWRGQLWRLSLRQWLQLAVIGVVFAVHWLTYFMSIKLATPSIAALAITTYGVQYMLLAYFFNGERVTPWECLAIAVSFGGCVLVLPDLELASDVSRGVLIGLFSALLYAALPLLHQRAESISTSVRTWGQFSFGLLCFLPLYGQGNWELSPVDWQQLFVLGVLCTVIAHGLWVKSSTELPAIYSSMIYYLYLPLASVGSVLLLGEDYTSQKALGALLVVGASATLSLYRFRRGQAR